MIQDFGPVWNLGCNPAEGLAATWAALEARAAQRRAAGARLVASTRRPSRRRCAPAAAGLKIHEDVGAGARADRAPRSTSATRHDVQLAIHTDGLNEALSRRRTRSPRSPAARCTRSTSRAPAAATRRTCSTSPARERPLPPRPRPTVPFGVDAEAEHLAMVARRARARPGRPRRRLRRAAALRVRPAHDGRRGRAARPRRDPDASARTRRAWAASARSCAARSRTPHVMKRARGAEAGPGRQRARAALPRQGHESTRRSRTGSPSTSARCSRAGSPTRCSGSRTSSACGPSSSSRPASPPGAPSGDGNATTMLAEPVARRAADRRARRRPGAAVARLPGRAAAMDAELPTTRARAARRAAAAT